MRSGMHVTGSAIDRVFTQPILPPRRFRGVVDAALTLALGCVCAFGLTFGPAPLNTVAASSAASASFTGNFDPTPGLALLPAGADADSDSASDSGSEPGAGDSGSVQDGVVPAPNAGGDAVSQSPGESSTVVPPAESAKKVKDQPAQKAKPKPPVPSPKADKPKPAPKPVKPDTGNGPELRSEEHTSELQ